MSYLHTMGETRAVTWEAAVGSVGSTGADSIDGNRVPCPGEEGLS